MTSGSCLLRRSRTSDFPELLPNRTGLIAPNGLGLAWGRSIRKSSTQMSVRRAMRRPAQPKDPPMRFLYSFAVAMLLAILLPVLQSSAFTIDPASGTNPDGSSRFMDPDEQIHSSFFGGPAVNKDGWADRNSAYRNFSPGADGSNQGITFPNLFFPLAAPLKHQFAMKGIEGKRLTYRQARQ